MKRQKIQHFLDEMEIKDFEDGSQNILTYEQYRTPTDLAADILFHLQ
jgi:hypothetical protein